MRSIAKAAKSAIFALTLTLALAACNNSDDISEIFIGHDWRLTYIEEGGIRRWPAQDSGYSIMFGEYSFNATTPNGGRISGRWSANGETRQFSCTNIRTEGYILKRRQNTVFPLHSCSLLLPICATATVISM